MALFFRRMSMTRGLIRWLRCLPLLWALSACGGDDVSPPDLDAGDVDAGSSDAGQLDAGPRDAGRRDAGDVDALICPDLDGDGHTDLACGGDDCDDGNASRYPGATEVCDLDDEDCDDTTLGTDGDGDGFVPTACCNGSTCGTDCNDTDSNVHPGATEVCDGFDNDCDVSVDEGVCVACGTGYTGFDGTCTDVDECAAGTAACTQIPVATCENTVGSFLCHCPTGYEGDGRGGGGCADIDECARGVDDCNTHATCTNSVGGFACACAPGYTGDGHGVGGCLDVDECASATTCDQLEGNGCANATGGYTCACVPGFAASGAGLSATCANVNECVLSLDTCGRALSGGWVNDCTDTSGGYACACGAGFAASGSGLAATCVNVDECATSAAQCGRTLGGGAVNGCTDTSGGYTCACGAGFVASGSGVSATCVNVDECTLSAMQCGRTFIGGSVNGCTDTSGGYTCACGAGFVSSGSGFTAGCVNVDECATSPAQCGRALGGGSVNGCADISGGYLCTCGAGFAPSGSGLSATCVNVDECALSATQCGRALDGGSVNGCTDTSAGYTCSCGAGFEPLGTGLTATCGDVNECMVALDDCEHVVATCANTSGGYTCACAAGFVGTGHGTGSCRWDDPSLGGLTVGAGATLGPAFDASTLVYTVTLAPGATSTMVTPTVPLPARATVTVGGTAVTSGIGTVVSVSGFAPRVVDVVVTTETGATRTYTLVVRRGPTYFKASNSATTDWFGSAMSLSADGTRLAVAAIQEDSSAVGVNGDALDNNAASSGAVYIFARTGATWAQEAYVKASNTAAFDAFGASVSLSADGMLLAVGAYSERSRATGVGGDETDDSMTDAGAVYVFARTGTTWAQEAYVKASNTQEFDRFGAAVALSGDGTRLAVGAAQESSSATGVDGNQADNSVAASGAVYVFARMSATWAQEAYLKASNTGSADSFGSSMSFSSDGTWLAVAAVREDSSATGVGGNQGSNVATESGAVYVFSRTGTAWSQQAYLKASNTGINDAFGDTVCMSTDGSRLAVSAPGEDSSASGVGGNQADNSVSNSGAAYVFLRTGTTWSQEAYVKASNPGADDSFGVSLSLSADGTRLAAGASGEDSNAVGIGGDQANNAMSGSGAAYVFSRAGTTWSQEAYVKASNTDYVDAFGTCVALSSDGRSLAVAASKEYSNATGINGNQLNNSALDAGATYVY
jgi:hypothetical protein